MELALVTEQIVAGLMLVLGISLVIRPDFWVHCVHRFIEYPESTLGVGFFGLFFGLWVVSTHNIWVAEPKVIITLFGWLALIKYSIFFVAPAQLLKLGKNVVLKPAYVIAGVIYAVVGSWLLISTV